MTSAVMATYDRFDIAFGARRRRVPLLDRGSALSRFRRRGRCDRSRPLSPTPDGRLMRAGPSYLALLEPVPYPRSGAPGAAVGRRNLRRCGILLQLRRRSDRVRTEAGAQVSRHRGRPRPLPGDHLRRRVSMDEPWRPSPRAALKKYLEGFQPKVDGFDHAPFGNLDAVRRQSDHRRRRSWWSRFRERGRHSRRIHRVPAGGFGELADAHGCLCSSTKFNAAWAAPGRLFAHDWFGVTPDLMALAKGLGGGFPWAPACHGAARRGLRAGQPRIHVRGQSVGDGCRQRRARFVLDHAFLAHVREMGRRCAGWCCSLRVFRGSSPRCEASA